MSTLVGLRAFNRSRKPRVGGKTVGTTTTYVNVDNPRVKRDLSQRSAIGSFLPASSPFFSGDDGVVLNGCVATGTAVAGQIAVSAGRIKTAAGVEVAVPAANITLTDPTTNPNLAVVLINTTNGALDQVRGAETAGLTAERALDFHETYTNVLVPASRIAIAHVFVPAVLVPVTAAQIRDVRP